MPDFPFIAATAGGIGTVAGFMLRHFTNGHLKTEKADRADRGVNEVNAAEFRGESRAVMESIAKTQEKIVDLMGDVHSEIAHTNQVLEIIEQRGRGQEEAIRKVLAR